MKKEDMVTRELCTLVFDTSIECKGDPVWRLDNECETMYVCDAHLANAIRKCGAPAIINCYTPIRGCRVG